MIVLDDILNDAADIVDGGLCKDDPRVVTRINEATERLFYVRRGQHQQTQEVTLQACGCYVSLDYRYERIVGRTAQVDGVVVPVRGTGYEKLERGPGEIDCKDGNAALIFEGQRSAYHPLSNKQVLILPDSPEDELGCVNVQGTDSTNREVVRGKRGEDIGISNKSPKFSVTEFRGELTAVTKPITKGWVYGYAFDPETNYKQLLFAMHPLQRSVQFARYKVVGVNDFSTVTADAFQKWYPVAVGTDVLPVQSKAAILDQLRAIEARRANEPQAEAINSNSARAQLDARSSYGDHGPEGVDIRVDGGGYNSYGDVY